MPFIDPFARWTAPVPSPLAQTPGLRRNRDGREFGDRILIFLFIPKLHGVRKSLWLGSLALPFQMGHITSVFAASAKMAHHIHHICMCYWRSSSIDSISASPPYRKFCAPFWQFISCGDSVTVGGRRLAMQQRAQFGQGLTGLFLA